MLPATIRTIGLSLAILFLCHPAFAQDINARNYNERFLPAVMQQLIGAQGTYQAITGDGNFGTLAELHGSGLIDAALASGRKYGYVFTVDVTPANAAQAAAFTITATPAKYRKTGIRSYFADTSGTIRAADLGGNQADLSTPAIDACIIWGNSDNERCIRGTLRQIHSVQALFQSFDPLGNFGSLSQLKDAGLINDQTAFGTLRGYVITLNTVPRSAEQPPSFAIWAVPTEYGTTGRLSFYIDQTGVIRGADHNGKPGGPDDPTVEN